jgi:hypothetical protein
MRFTNDGRTFSATDLSSHSECEHRTVLEIGVAFGKWKRPGQSEIRTDLLTTKPSMRSSKPAVTGAD